MDSPSEIKGTKNRTQNLLRTTEFWRRAAGIYLSYKTQQVNAWRLRRQGWSADRLRAELWQPHHTWAGAQLDTSWRIHLRLNFQLAASAMFLSRVVPILNVHAGEEFYQMAVDLRGFYLKVACSAIAAVLGRSAVQP